MDLVLMVIGALLYAVGYCMGWWQTRQFYLEKKESS